MLPPSHALYCHCLAIGFSAASSMIHRHLPHGAVAVLAPVTHSCLHLVPCRTPRSSMTSRPRSEFQQLSRLMCHKHERCAIVVPPSCCCVVVSASIDTSNLAVQAQQRSLGHDCHRCLCGPRAACAAAHLREPGRKDQQQHRLSQLCTVCQSNTIPDSSCNIIS